MGHFAIDLLHLFGSLFLDLLLSPKLLFISSYLTGLLGLSYLLLFRHKNSVQLVLLLLLGILFRHESSFLLHLFVLHVVILVNSLLLQLLLEFFRFILFML